MADGRVRLRSPRPSLWRGQSAARPGVPTAAAEDPHARAWAGRRRIAASVPNGLAAHAAKPQRRQRQSLQDDSLYWTIVVSVLEDTPASRGHQPFHPERRADEVDLKS